MTRGAVYRRGRIWWVRYYWKGKLHAESSRSQDKKDAETFLARRLGEIGADAAGVKRWIGPSAGKTLVTALLDDLELDYEVTGKRSLRVARGRMVPLRKSFEREVVMNVDTARLRRYIQERQRAGRLPATIKLEIAFLRRAFTIAHKEGRITEVPVFPSIKVDNARQGFFEQADFEAVRSFLSTVLADMATFAYLSGWRKMEVQMLRWAEVDLLGRVAKLSPERSKGNKGRTLPLVGELWEIVQRRYEARRYELIQTCSTPHMTVLIPWVFHRDSQPIRQFKTAWKVACRKAGVPHMVFHDLRRTAVRNLIRAGVPQKTAMEITGHRTIGVFQRYDIVDEEDLRLAQSKLQGYLASQSGEQRSVIPIESTMR
jgi:integrase